jgi:GNAT superfamily N-acetyltransferase/23S rRNA U2552 (ribose-2'-O)-methylase RlmE/FtsJ
MNQIINRINDLTLYLTNTPGKRDRNYIYEKILDFNQAIAPDHCWEVQDPRCFEPLALFIRGPSDRLLGGLVGRTYWDWLEVDNLWVDESLRRQGLGRTLLTEAETEAIMRGCTGAHLKTFSFQAKRFYEASAYRPIGQLGNCPPGEVYYWLRKDFGRDEYISFKSVRTDTDVLDYLVQLNRNRPKRKKIITHIVEQLVRLAKPNLNVLELCAGPGMLAQYLIRQLPHANYTGFDYSPAFVDFVQRRVSLFKSRAVLYQADLNRDEWLKVVPHPLHAIISMQSLHDLGDESHVSRMYELARQLLAPGGVFINADFTVPAGTRNPDNPGRLSIPRHLDLLRMHGFEQVQCSLEEADGFVCMIAFVSD